MIIKTVNWTEADVQNFANEIKDLVCSKVKIDAQKYVMLVVRKGLFGKIIDRLLGKEEGFRIEMVEISKPLVDEVKDENK